MRFGCSGEMAGESHRIPLPAGVRGAAVAVLASALAVGLSGCGFQLPATSLADSIQTVRLRADPSVDFVRQLGHALRRAGVSVVQGEADVVLELGRQEQERRTVSVAADARVAEYELALKVEVAAKDRNGVVLMPARVLRIERIAQLDRDYLVSSGDEEAILGEQMRAELCGRILRALAAAPPRTSTG